MGQPSHWTIIMALDSPTKTHIDMYDRDVRARWTRHFGVTDERLRKAVRMVGSRITTITDHFGLPKL
jgi:hypothetical protein